MFNLTPIWFAEVETPPAISVKSIKEYASITINCNSSDNTFLSHVWWFDNRIIFANGYDPTEIGIDNVRVEYLNSASYLHFDGFLRTNSGNYTCVEGDVKKSIYILDILCK